MLEIGSWLLQYLLYYISWYRFLRFGKIRFFYHPLFMTLSFLFFMGQGVFLITSNFSLLETIASFCCVLDKSRKKKIHVMNQSLATVLYISGFIMIFTHVGSHNHHIHEHNETSNGTVMVLHFESWHSKFGIFTVFGSFISQFVLGITLFFYTHRCSPLPQLQTLTKIHRISTLCFFSLGLWTIFLALVSFDLDWSIISRVFLGFCLVVIFCTVIPHGLRLLHNNPPLSESLDNFEDWCDILHM